RADAVRLDGYYAPRHLDDFAAWYEAHPDALILAGGTDVGLWVTKQLRELPPLLYIGEVAELQAITDSGDGLDIGAAVRLEDAFAALVQRYPQLDELMRRFASRPIRNSGTLCGNIANGSPIGDAMPALIALGARVSLRRGADRRSLALEDLYLGYQKKALAAGEFVASVWVPAPQPDTLYAAYKISKRYDQDISALCAGLAVCVRDGQVAAARLAFGGMAATPSRAAHAERALIGQAWSRASVDAAAAALAEDFQPITDLRASAAYRAVVAGNLLRRFWLEWEAAAATRVENVTPISLEASP
ncbi:MAG: FAD binding domain-containing protein, partial [Rhodocyclaceae bacterium]|nr:FAD binding domain-containing protein [Rhodocyclaceae bacterium]